MMQKFNDKKEEVDPIRLFLESEEFKNLIQADGSIKLQHPMLSLKKAFQELKKQSGK